MRAWILRLRSGQGPAVRHNLLDSGENPQMTNVNYLF